MRAGAPCMVLLAAAIPCTTTCGGGDSGAHGRGTRSYAVWLVPTGAPRDRLRERIVALARRHGTPRFEPHVTLLGLGPVPRASEDEVVAAVAELLREVPRLTLTLQEVEYEDAYYRSLYLRVKPTEELMRAGARGADLYRRLWGRDPADPRYVPHLSLLYGDLSPAQKDEIVATELGDVRSPDADLLVDRAQLWVTDGPPGDWFLLREFALGRDESAR